MFFNAEQSFRLPVMSYFVTPPYIIDYINKQRFMYDLFIEMNKEKKKGVKKKKPEEIFEAHKVLKKFNKSNLFT